MNFNEMKLAIYESYSNGEITRDAASRLINSFENASIDHELDLALEAVDNAESSFMESAMKYSTGDIAQEVFEAKATSLGNKVKKAWVAFKKWVKDIIDKIDAKIKSVMSKLTGDKKKVYQKAKFSFKFDLKGIKDDIDTANKKLKSQSLIDTFHDPWWNGYYQRMMKRSAVGFAAGFGITGAGYYVLTGKARDDLVDAIRAGLFTLSNTLDKLEASATDSKFISFLRPAVNVANRAIMAAYPSIGSRREENNNERYRSTQASAAEMIKDYPDLKAIEDELNKLKEEQKAAEDKLNNTDRSDFNAHFNAVDENIAIGRRIVNLETRLFNAYSKYNAQQDMGIDNLARALFGQYVGMVIGASKTVIRSAMVDVKKIAYSANPDKELLGKYISGADEVFKEFYTTEDNVKKIQQMDPGRDADTVVKMYYRAKKTIDSYKKSYDALIKVVKSKGLA